MEDKRILAGFIGVIALVVIVTGFVISKIMLPADLKGLANHVTVMEATPTKGVISLETNLYDELPNIEKYPLAVQGDGDIDIEIFTSGEKAGTDTDSWLIDCANNFNNSNVISSDGQRITMSVRSVSSGLAADYIISGKYTPDLYTPSNYLFAEYANANGANLTAVSDRLVGNTSGILVKKNSGYKKADDIIADVCAGKINLGYTNPQTSATGLNLLMYLLSTNGDAVDSAEAIAAFKSFNANIPYVAYTTQQMKSSASNGSFDALITEYQAYINDSSLVKSYDFIPFGIRNDNPLYAVNMSRFSVAEKEAVQIITNYLTGADCQAIASQDGFNELDKYKSSYEITGLEISKGLSVYKSNKDGNVPIVAVFVADCSGSMAGDAINELKNSLSNGINYINENNYIGLISYSSSVTIEAPIAKFDMNQKSYFQGGVNNLVANGGTCTYEATCVAANMIEDFVAAEGLSSYKPMVFVLSDGYANGVYSISTITDAIQNSEIPIYTIAYTADADTDELRKLSSINEAASISADSEDVVYKIKSLFNSQL